MSSTSIKRILFIGPSHYETSKFDSFKPEYEIIPHNKGRIDEENIYSLDIPSYIKELVTFANSFKEPFDAVTSTNDYPGILLAAIVGKALGMTYIPDIKILLKLLHKVVARDIEESVISDYLPKWARLNPGDTPSLPFPFFIRPAKAAGSMFSQKVSSLEELETYFELSKNHLDVYCSLFDRLWEKEISDGNSVKCYLIEELIEGAVQVTVDGFVFKGIVKALGVTDSIFFPNSISFQRFDYPSRLSEKAVKLMMKVAEQAIISGGLDNSMWNIEFFYYPKSGHCTLIEINTRMSYQFSDLYEMVDGTNLYEAQFQIACGITPTWTYKEGPYQVATSFVLRSFEDACIQKMPTKETLKALSEEYPLSRVLFFGQIKEGQMISEASFLNDMDSFRYGFINIGGANWDNLNQNVEAFQQKMGLMFSAVKS